ncbi:MAG: F0F1 ATP synthase subunit B [Acidobacteriota bacterium]
MNQPTQLTATPRSGGRRLAVLAAGVATAALIVPITFAADKGGEGGSGSNIFGGDIGNVLWTLVTFGLALFVLGKFAWGPLLDMLQKREAFIRDSLVQAKQDREAAEARLREYEERLADARAEATAIVEEGRRDAEVVRGKVEADAREEAAKTLARAKREIQIAKDTAVKDLYALAGNLATDIAAKIVDREIRPDDHQKLINEALDELATNAADQRAN